MKNHPFWKACTGSELNFHLDSEESSLKSIKFKAHTISTPTVYQIRLWLKDGSCKYEVYHKKKECLKFIDEWMDFYGKYTKVEYVEHKLVEFFEIKDEEMPTRITSPEMVKGNWMRKRMSLNIPPSSLSNSTDSSTSESPSPTKKRFSLNLMKKLSPRSRDSSRDPSPRTPRTPRTPRSNNSSPRTPTSGRSSPSLSKSRRSFMRKSLGSSTPSPRSKSVRIGVLKELLQKVEKK